MAYFPLFVNLQEKHVLVIGGGMIATRRVKSLLEFGCRIWIVAPEVTGEMKCMIENGKASWICGAYSSLNQIAAGDKKPIFVLAAANPEVNQAVVDDCRKAGIPVNDASKKENCDFYFPGLVKEGDVIVGITAGGTDHKLASELTSNIRSAVQDRTKQKAGTSEKTDVPNL